MTHLTFERISEIADGPQTPADREPHLAECPECQDTLRRVRALVASARTLPRNIEPPAEIWTSLRTRVGAAPARASARWRFGWLATAAAIIIVAGIALLVPGQPGVRKGKAKALPPVATAPAPVMHLAIEQNYTATVDELRRALETQRATLSPATIRVLERSLATIDTAIAEARAALATDPANQILIKILSANYERKVELLQRATELQSSS
jgi:hypothetical protein